MGLHPVACLLIKSIKIFLKPRKECSRLRNQISHLLDALLTLSWSVLIMLSTFSLRDSIPSQPILFTFPSPLGWNLLMQNNFSMQPSAWRELQELQNTAVHLSHTAMCTSNHSAVLYNGSCQSIKWNLQYWSLPCSATQIWDSMDRFLLGKRQLMTTIPLIQ